MNIKDCEIREAATYVLGNFEHYSYTKKPYIPHRPMKF